MHQELVCHSDYRFNSKVWKTYAKETCIYCPALHGSSANYTTQGEYLVVLSVERPVY